MTVDWTAVSIALIAGVPATIAAIAAVRGRREGKATHAEVATNDGKTSGETLHGIAQTVEVIQTDQHGVNTKLGRIEEKVDRIDGRVDRVDTKLERHLAEVGEGSGPMADWVRKQMNEDAE